MPQCEVHNSSHTTRKDIERVQLSPKRESRLSDVISSSSPQGLASASFDTDENLSGRNRSQKTNEYTARILQFVEESQNSVSPRCSRSDDPRVPGMDEMNLRSPARSFNYAGGSEKKIHLFHSADGE